MSLPTSTFSKLAISGMPPTPSSTARQSRTKDDPVSSSDESSGSSEESDNESDTSASGTLTSRNTKLRYNASLLSPTVSSRARAGLKSRFTFTTCSAPSTEYYAFQISEPTNFVVRVGAPGSEYSTLTCTCNDTRPCRHIFFLLDQIAHYTLTEEQKRATLPLTRDGMPCETFDAFQKIKDTGPQQLFRKLKINSTTNSDENEQTEPQGSIAVGSERINDVRDILAFFSRTESRDEHRPDIFDNIRVQATSESQLFPEDLEKTLALSMITNDALFHHMRSIVSTDHCASDYFQKKRERILNALRAMDDYTSTKKWPQGLPTPDVAWCAKVIEATVNEIVARVDEARSPLLPAAKQSAAKALSQTLYYLSERNVDVYNRQTWRHHREQALDIKDRNIFVRFFGHPPQNGKKFILDDLSDLGDAPRDYLPLMENAAEAFGDNKVHKPYADKLQRLIRDLKKQGRGNNSRSGSKRPGDESGGDSKRMK